MSKPSSLAISLMLDKKSVIIFFSLIIWVLYIDCIIISIDIVLNRLIVNYSKVNYNKVNNKNLLVHLFLIYQKYHFSLVFSPLLNSMLCQFLFSYLSTNRQQGNQIYQY